MAEPNRTGFLGVAREIRIGRLPQYAPARWNRQLCESTNARVEGRELRACGVPDISESALSRSDSELNLTKPKPLDLPVPRSVTTFAARACGAGGRRNRDFAHAIQCYKKEAIKPNSRHPPNRRVLSL